MTLPQIDKRLDLFKEYLGYYLNNYSLNSSHIIHHIFITTGLYYHNRFNTFDRWLIGNGYPELAINKYPLINEL